MKIRIPPASAIIGWITSGLAKARGGFTPVEARTWAAEGLELVGPSVAPASGVARPVVEAVLGVVGDLLRDPPADAAEAAGRIVAAVGPFVGEAVEVMIHPDAGTEVEIHS